jgi:hypothetical protein
LLVVVAVVLVALVPLVIGVLVARTALDRGGQQTGRTFYVNSAGSDAADGASPQQAWQTLNRASEERLRPGDRLLLTGQLTGTLQLGPGDAGDADNPVVIDSYGGSRASITSDHAIVITDTAGITVRNLGIYGSGSGAENAGILALASTARSDRLRGITLEDLDVKGFLNGIAVGAEGSGGFADVAIRNTTVYGNRNNGLIVYGPKFDSAHPIYAHTRVAISGVLSYNNTGSPTNHDSNSGNGIVIGSVDTGHIALSTAHGNGTTAGNVSEGPVGIWAYDSTRITIEHNLSYSNRTLGTDGGGFGLDQNTTDSVLQYNLAYDNYGAGFLLFGMHSNRSNARNTVRYNISVDDSRRGYLGSISLFGGTGGADDNGRVEQAKVYQNTVVINEVNPSTPALLLAGSVDGAVVANNLLSGPVAVAGRQPNGQIRLHGNDYFSIGPHLIAWNTMTYDNVEDWRRATGAEVLNGTATGVQSSPQLTDPVPPTAITEAKQLGGATGFAPRPGSALIGSGVPLSAVGVTDTGGRDFLGAAVTSQADIGAIAK